MREKFEEIESQFQELKKKFKLKKISEREFRYRLKKLRLDAPDGRCWTIGARSGRWYYFDGDKWIEADPPSLQQGKVICIFCGFENDIHSEVCEYCGGRLDSKQMRCPECGFVLESPGQTCPVCEITSDKHEKKEKTEQEERTDDFSQTSWDEIEEMDEQRDQDEEMIEKEEVAIETVMDLNEPNYIARFINPSSFFLLFGIFGLIVGLSLGAVVGATSLFSDFIATLPEFFSTLQGKIHGGLLFGLFGGLLGLLFLGLVGFLTAVFVNMILSLIGGIKLRIDKIEK